MLVVLVLLLGFLPQILCKTQSVHPTLKSHPFTCRGRDDFSISHDFYQPGDIIIGNIASQFFASRTFSNFSEHPSQKLIKDLIVVPKRYQQVLALVFAIREINENPAIFNNITFGFHSFENYGNKATSYKTLLNLLSARHRFVPNYKCDVLNNLVAITWTLDTDTSLNMATIIDIYKIPQIVFGSLDPKMKNTHFPSSYQMMPNDIHQYHGTVQLLLHYKWTWVGIFLANYDNEEIFLQTLQPMLSSKGICVAFAKTFPASTYTDRMLQALFRELQNISIAVKSNANVFIAYGSILTMSHLIRYFQSAVMHSPLGKVWIVTSNCDFRLCTHQRTLDVQAFQGAISVSVHSNEPPGFRTFLQNTNVFSAKVDGFIQTVWEKTFNCLLKNSTLGEGENTKEHCSGEEKLESLPGTLFEMRMTGHSYSVYNAVHAIARALHTMLASRPKYRTWIAGDRLVLKNLEGFQIPNSRIWNFFINYTYASVIALTPVYLLLHQCIYCCTGARLHRIVL